MMLLLLLGPINGPDQKLACPGRERIFVIIQSKYFHGHMIAELRVKS
jgi:hypothetical protein